MADYTIQKMTLDDVKILLAWAASEGWNPGLDDAHSFYKADQQGFFVLRQNEVPTAGISVVKHDEKQAFLGLYICRPEFRRSGYGWRLWQHAIQTAGQRTIALDGVIEQQENYRKSGFEFAWNNYRYLAEVITAPWRVKHRRLTINEVSTKTISDLTELDVQVGGIERREFMTDWLTDSTNRASLFCESEGRLSGMGTIRKCIEGYKVGPLYADNADIADALLRALCETTGTQNTLIDVPENNEHAMRWIQNFATSPIFATARMYKGKRPRISTNQIYGITTLELG